MFVTDSSAASGRLLLTWGIGLNFVLSLASGIDAAERPNVVLILTDDQGFGDLGVHGNPKIATPQLDRFVSQSVALRHFCVSPVCSPTRASLLTGRYHFRTGVLDTINARAMLDSREVTLAEMLQTVGYHTAMFGKWHLGDNYPLRPIDQGFDEVLRHRGGAIGEPEVDVPDNKYFDPVLWHNGKKKRKKGYCTDIFTDAAIEFIRQNRKEPFFVYLAYNCPHLPLVAPQHHYRRYKQMDLGPNGFPQIGQPLPAQLPEDKIARVYGMVTSIDDNLGRLLSTLDQLGLSHNTIVVFLSDNGPQQPRYNGGLRGLKASVYEGGIRVPCFVRWPARLAAGAKVQAMAAHIDLVPTLLEMCSVSPPSEVKIDGVSLMRLLEGQTEAAPQRTLFFQWHRGSQPQRYRSFAVRTHRYKLVQAEGAWPGWQDTNPSFQLFQISADPYELHDIALQHPEIVTQLRAAYDQWFDELMRPEGFRPPRISLGTVAENPSTLTRQDLQLSGEGYSEREVGFWDVLVAREGRYEITLHFPQLSNRANATFQLGKATRSQPIPQSSTSVCFKSVTLPPGPARLRAWISEDKQRRGVSYVDTKRLD